MKKTYIQPTVEVFQMAVSQMVMTSTVTIQSDSYNESEMEDL